MKKKVKKIKIKTDWAGMQRLAGCAGCKFAIPEDIGKDCCCTYPGKLEFGEGMVCLKRRPAE